MSLPSFRTVPVRSCDAITMETSRPAGAVVAPPGLGKIEQPAGGGLVRRSGTVVNGIVVRFAIAKLVRVTPQSRKRKSKGKGQKAKVPSGYRPPGCHAGQ